MTTTKTLAEIKRLIDQSAAKVKAETKVTDNDKWAIHLAALCAEISERLDRCEPTVKTS
jgi:hypothetical protein